MLVVLFALTVIAAVVAYHFLVERPRERRLAEQLPQGRPAPLPATMGRLPNGVFLQPTYTWSRIQPEGDLLIGVHPMLLGLVGTPYQVDLVTTGGRVEKGSPLFRIEKNDRSLTVHSPVSGRVLEQKRVTNGEASWDLLAADNGGWVCRVVPEQVENEVPSWMIADRAADWTMRQYEEIRNHLFQAVAEREVGLTMADGGEIPVGILGQLGPAEWDAFEDAFLHA